jgi:hypothetical protein
MSYFTPKASDKQRGRPRGSGRIKKPEQKSTISAKLSPTLIEIIQSERRNNESYSDTIMRMLFQRTQEIATSRKKYDALLQRHTNLEIYVNNLLHNEV